MRLTDEPATCRQLYPRSRLTLPNGMPIDIPARFAGAGLPLGRCYPVILETAGVCRDGNRPRRPPSGPDLFDRRPSAFTPSTSSSSATHRPPRCSCAAGYPACTAMVPPAGDDFTRGAYTSEVFADAPDLDRAEARRRATFGTHPPVCMHQRPSPCDRA